MKIILFGLLDYLAIMIGIGLLKQKFYQTWEQPNTNNLAMGQVLAPWGCDQHMNLDENELTVEIIETRITELMPDWQLGISNGNQVLNFIDFPIDSYIVVTSVHNKTHRWLVQLTGDIRWDANADTGHGLGSWVRSVTQCKNIPYDTVTNGGHNAKTFIILKTQTAVNYLQIQGQITLYEDKDEEIVDDH